MILDRRQTVRPVYLCRAYCSDIAYSDAARRNLRVILQLTERDAGVIRQRQLLSLSNDN